MSIRDSPKEALKDPAVVQVLTNAITSSLRGEIRTLREALERKEEKVAELQDHVDSLEQYSRRNNVRISGIPGSTSAVANTGAIVKKVGEAIGVTIPDEMIDQSHPVGKPGKMGRDVVVKFTFFLLSHFFFCQAHLCGGFIQKHASIHYNIPFTLFHALLHHYSFTRHFLSDN